MAHPSQGSGSDDDREQPFGFGFPGLPGFPGGVPGLPGLGDLDLSQLLGMLSSPGPVNWEIAKQIARNVATEGKPERPIDPAAPAEFAELARAAQTHVAELTGLASTLATPVRVLGAVEWADLHLDALRPVLEDLARTLGTALAQEMQAELDAEAGTPDPMAAIMPMLTPVLLGLQAGSMIGYLALHALGRYDLPLPAADAPSLCFVVRHIDDFEDAWSLPRADLRFTLATHEVVHAAMRAVPWVSARLQRLASEYVRAYHLDLSAIEERFGMLDPSDPQSFERLTAHPRDILGAMASPAQHDVQERLRVFATVLEGYADAVIARVTERLVPTGGQIHEAFTRHRIDRGEAGHFVDALLGIDLGRDDYDRGRRFCDGVIERAGLEGLNRLWMSEAMVPTPSELDAPGLWLARIDLPDPS
ncbi:MAG: zinc-dependent metalloprotease [Actinobacteria bacterium]|nr:zinc-dependent metalloprotease [Actinomycetota bacterium]